MADRTVRVRLIAEVADFKRQMGEATRAVDALPAGTAKAETGLGRLVQSAKYNRQAWTTVGTAVTAVGVAILAVGAAALKTGISYNTLQQTTRAALTTLLGSAQAANAQMDKLDEFARTSPFAKQVFISAQQQMIGFGIATQKVIPYLDAMQNAVAAMGGSNDDVAELTRIMAEISASSKITAVDLMQFGKRGIDAATLIGSQMGKTGAQIREDITAGTLDAQVALDALAAGMQSQFGGAAAGMKETFAGAIDRVKAAWRDFSGMLAEPLVGAEGGGAFIGLLNGAADLMRAVMALPEPVKVAVEGIVGLTGAASVLGGGFLLLAPRIIDTVDALKDLGLWTKATAIGLGKGAILGLAAVLLGVADAAQTAAVSSEELKNRLTALESGAAGVVALFSDIGQGWADNLSLVSFDVGATSADDFRASLQLLNDSLDGGPIGDFSKMMNDIVGTDGGLRQFGIRVRQIGDELGSLAASDLPSASEQFNRLVDAAGGGKEVVAQLVNQMPAYRDALYAAATAQGVTLDETTLLAAATGELALGADAAGGAQGDLAADYDITTDSIKAQLPTLEDLIGLQATAAGKVLSERDAQRAFQQSIIDATEALKTNGQTLDITTAAGIANQDALDGITDSAWKVQTSMQAADATQAELVAAMQVSRDAFVNMAIAEGMSADEANRLADKMNLIPAKVASAVSVDISGAVRDVETLKAILRNIPNPVITPQMRATNPYYANRAGGGEIAGPGTGTSDSILSRLSNGEHVLTASEVGMAGGQSAVYRMRAAIRAGALRFAGGGEVQGYAGGGGVYAQRQYAGTPQWSGGSAASAAAPVRDLIDYNRLARAMANVQIGLNGQVVSQSVDQWIGARVR